MGDVAGPALSGVGNLRLAKIERGEDELDEIANPNRVSPGNIKGPAYRAVGLSGQQETARRIGHVTVVTDLLAGPQHLEPPRVSVELVQQVVHDVAGLPLPIAVENAQGGEGKAIGRPIGEANLLH